MDITPPFTMKFEKFAVVIALGFLLFSTACERGVTQAGLADAKLEQVLSIGLLDGEDTEVFGIISDVRAGPDGSLLVLDRQSAAVSWFSVEGEYLGGIRSRGAGPGELAGPSALDISGSGSVLVIDPPNARYSFYEIGPGGLQHTESIGTLSSSVNTGRHVCSVNGRRFVRDVQGEFGIHEFDRQGRILRSFGEVELAREEEFGRVTSLVSTQRNSGHLLCIDDQRMIVSLDTYTAGVRAYSLDGELMWRTESEGFYPIHFAAVDGGMRFEVGPDGFHLGESILRWTDDSILIQRSLSWPPGTAREDRDRDFFSLDSRELLLLNGSEVGRTDDLPFLVDAHEDRYYGFENLPHPRVLQFTRR